MSPHSPALTHHGYKGILDGLTTAVLVLGEDLSIRYLNPAAESLFKISSARSQGLLLNDVLIDSEGALKTLHEAARDGRTYTRREAEFFVLFGSRLVVDYSVTPLSTNPTELLMEIQPRERLMRITREEDIISQQEASRILVRGMAHEIKNELW